MKKIRHTFDSLTDKLLFFFWGKPHHNCSRSSDRKMLTAFKCGFLAVFMADVFYCILIMVGLYVLISSALNNFGLTR